MKLHNRIHPSQGQQMKFRTFGNGNPNMADIFLIKTCRTVTEKPRRDLTHKPSDMFLPQHLGC